MILIVGSVIVSMLGGACMGWGFWSTCACMSFCFGVGWGLPLLVRVLVGGGVGAARIRTVLERQS